MVNMSDLKLSGDMALENPTPKQIAQEQAIEAAAPQVLSDAKVKKAIASLQEAFVQEGRPGGSAINEQSLTYKKSEELIATLAASLNQHGINDAPESGKALKASLSQDIPAQAFEASVLMNALKDVRVKTPEVISQPLTTPLKGGQGGLQDGLLGGGRRGQVAERS